MFTGLIQYRGEVTCVERLAEGGLHVRIRCDGIKREAPEAKDSIAINGVCLTATEIRKREIAFDVVPETLMRSTLGSLKERDTVNVEYSLKFGDRMGGHFVYGHVDAAARIISRIPEGQGVRLRIERLVELAPMLAGKAFVAIDGVSLTIATVGSGQKDVPATSRDQKSQDWFEIALIPETLERTTLGGRHAGDLVNIEVDPLARYVESILSSRAKANESGRSTIIARSETLEG